MLNKTLTYNHTKIFERNIKICFQAVPTWSSVLRLPCQVEPCLCVRQFLLPYTVAVPSRTDSVSHFPSDFTPTDFLKERLDASGPLVLHPIKPSLSFASPNRTRSWKKQKKNSSSKPSLTFLLAHPRIPELSGLNSNSLGVFPLVFFFLLSFLICWVSGQNGLKLILFLERLWP